MKGDGPVRARREWDRLSLAERKVAAGAVERVFQLRRGAGGAARTVHPAAHTYLRNRVWLDAPPPAASGPAARVPVRPFSRDFWVVFFGRVLRGGNWQFLAQMARDGTCMVPADEAPTMDQLSGFVPVLVRGADGRSTAEFSAWEQWFRERGVRMPRPERSDRVFMPAATPGAWAARPDAASGEAA